MIIDQNRTLSRENAAAILLVCLILLTATAGCSRKNMHVPAPATAATNDNSYMDLEPGWKLRIVIPVTKSGAFRLAIAPQRSNGNTITMSADDLIGYETAYYAVEAQGNRGVRLEFASAEMTKDGQAVGQPVPPPLPFELPRRTEHIRLLYFVRVSQVDHNMAIVAAKRMEALNVFTKQVKADPTACHSSGEIFCSWVPAGIAVRPEKQQ